MTLRLLLLDEGFMGSAYTAAALRDAGCRVTVLAGTGGRGGHDDGRGLAWSLAPAAGSAAYLAAVDRAARSGAFDRVLPLTEPIQHALWETDPPWAALLHPRAEPWQRELLADKRRLAEFLAAREIAIPPHRELGTTSLDEAISVLGLPIVVKGVRGRGGATTRIAESAGAAAAAARALSRTGVECFVQRYVPGATFLVGGLFHQGHALRLYAGEKLEQHPPRTGPAIRLRSLSDAELLRPALATFEALRWCGLASADFIRDQDGRYLFLEVNPRPWGSIAAAASAGVDLFTPLAALLRGDTPASDLAFRTGAECTVFPLYLASPGHWRGLRALRSAARDLRGDQGRLWHPPGQALHLLHRLWRVVRRWP